MAKSASFAGPRRPCGGPPSSLVGGFRSGGSKLRCHTGCLGAFLVHHWQGMIITSLCKRELAPPGRTAADVKRELPEDQSEPPVPTEPPQSCSPRLHRRLG